MHAVCCLQNRVAPDTSEGLLPLCSEHHAARINIMTPSWTSVSVVQTNHWSAQLRARQPTPTHLPSRQTAQQTVSSCSEAKYFSSTSTRMQTGTPRRDLHQPYDNLPYQFFFFLRAQMLVKYFRLVLAGVKAQVGGVAHINCLSITQQEHCPQCVWVSWYQVKVPLTKVRLREGLSREWGGTETWGIWDESQNAMICFLLLMYFWTCLEC